MASSLSARSETAQAAWAGAGRGPVQPSQSAHGAGLCGFNRIDSMKYWEIIADHLSSAGWSWGCVATVDSNGRTIFVADAHRGDGKRFVVRADEKLTAFVELESEIRAVLEIIAEKAA